MSYLGDKGILVNEYFKTYLTHPAYQEGPYWADVLVDIVTVADMGFEEATTAPQIEMRALALGY